MKNFVPFICVVIMIIGAISQTDAFTSPWVKMPKPPPNNGGRKRFSNVIQRVSSLERYLRDIVS